MGTIGIVAASSLAGLAVGSFLTALTARVETRESVLRGRSHCDSCGRTLEWFELLPVLSFMFQGGQCRSCASPISRAYPAMEVITAVLFGAIAWASVSGAIALPPFLGGEAGVLPGEAALVFLYYAFFASIGVAVSFYDFEHRLIPLPFVVPLIAAGALAHVVGALRASTAAPLFISAVFAVITFALFWSLWFFSRGRAMGRGDADAALAVASFLNPAAGAAAFLFAFWLGAASGVVLILAGRAGWKSRIPFAPFLFAGAVVAIFSVPYTELFSLLRYV